MIGNGQAGEKYRGPHPCWWGGLMRLAVMRVVVGRQACQVHDNKGISPCDVAEGLVAARSLGLRTVGKVPGNGSRRHCDWFTEYFMQVLIVGSSGLIGSETMNLRDQVPMRDLFKGWV